MAGDPAFAAPGDVGAACRDRCGVGLQPSVPIVASSPSLHRAWPSPWVLHPRVITPARAVVDVDPREDLLGIVGTQVLSVQPEQTSGIGRRKLVEARTGFSIDVRYVTG